MLAPYIHKNRLFTEGLVEWRQVFSLLCSSLGQLSRSHCGHLLLPNDSFLFQRGNRGLGEKIRTRSSKQCCLHCIDVYASFNVCSELQGKLLYILLYALVELVEFGRIVSFMLFLMMNIINTHYIFSSNFSSVKGRGRIILSVNFFISR